MGIHKFYIGIFYITALCLSCLGQKNKFCENIDNKSSSYKIANKDSLCIALKKMPEKGFALNFYLQDDLPELTKKATISQSFFLQNRQEKAASIFISITNKKFTALFTPTLKSEKYLLQREAFQLFLHEQLKESSSLMLQNITAEFIRLF